MVSAMNNRRERGSRAALFDDSIEEGGIRASSSYSGEIDEHSNDRAIDSLQDRVIFLKKGSANILRAGAQKCHTWTKLTGDIHEEAESHNRMLDRMGNEMDSSRGIMSGTMDRFKMVFEKKSSRQMCKLAAYFVVSFFIIYYGIRVLGFFMSG
ncbi:hypothetical protein CsSME_00020681 [Camellia sinensis var. sinensis]